MELKTERRGKVDKLRQFLQEHDMRLPHVHTYVQVPAHTRR